jgi:hypothetical protein
MQTSPHLRVLHLAKYAPPVRGGMETTTTELLTAFADRDDVSRRALRRIAAIAPSLR